LTVSALSEVTGGIQSNNNYRTASNFRMSLACMTNLLLKQDLPKYVNQESLRGLFRMSIRAYRVLLLTIGAALAFCATTAVAESKTYPEHEVKAAFMYNFLKFTDWPEEKVPDGNEAVNIFVVGDYPECKTFRDIQEKSQEGNPVRVQIFKSYEQMSDPNVLKDCHLLFICKNEKKYVGEILELVKDNNVLTVGEYEGFLEAGGIINFVEYREKLRFEVNMPAASEANLKLRSKLLKLAKRVITEDTES